VKSRSRLKEKESWNRLSSLSSSREAFSMDMSSVQAWERVSIGGCFAFMDAAWSAWNKMGCL
jgi:hypothetical protein